MKLESLMPLLGVSLVLSFGCSGERNSGKKNPAAAPSKPAVETPVLEVAILRDTLGMEGSEQEGQYKISVPQEDLSVQVDGFSIIPPMGLTSWVAFAPAPEGAVVMGDLVLQEDEIAPVQRRLVASGLTISGLHNHFVRDQPKVMFMHIHGAGKPEVLAQGVRAVLDTVRELRASKVSQRSPAQVKTTFDPSRIEAILGHRGTMQAGVYKITIGRPDVTLRDHGAVVSTFMGFNTWMAFQGTSEKAAVAGDFAMLEQEVAGVVSALVENGIEVVAVHNHMTTEQPRIFFLHFWGVGPVEDLARGLKAGLDQTASPSASGGHP